MRILIVDDNITICNLIKKYIKVIKCKADVDVALDGKAALCIMEKNKWYTFFIHTQPRFNLYTKLKAWYTHANTITASGVNIIQVPSIILISLPFIN